MLRDEKLKTDTAWQRTSRIVISGLLLLSAAQFVAAAVVYRSLGNSETDTLLFAGCLVFAALAFALCVAFWNSGAPTWKHKMAVAFVALPAVISIITR